MRKKQRWTRRALLAGAVSLHLLLPGQGFALDPAGDVHQYNCQTWSRPSGLPVNGINAIAQTKDGYLWLGTAVGLVRFDGIDFTLLDLGRVQAVRNSIVTSLASARDGGLWAGLENSAFGFCDGQSFSFRGRDNWGKTDLNVRGLVESKDGTLWLAGENGASRLTRAGSYEQVLGSSTPFPAYLVLCVYEDARGRLWFGTSGQGVYCWQNGKITKLPDPALDAADVLALAEDPEGRIWLGTGEGLYCYDTNLVRKEIPPLTVEIRALLVDRHGVLWVGTSSLGVARYQKGAYDFLRKTDGLASDYVKALAEDREGSLWIGTRDGLSQLTDIKFPTQNAAEDPTVKDAMAVGASRKGGLWVGSSGGLTYFDGKPKTYGVEAGLPRPYTKRVFEAGNGDVYLVSGTRRLVVFSGEKAVATYFARDLVVGIAEDAHSVVASVGGSLYRAGTNFFEPYVFTNGQPNLGWVLNLVSGRDGEIWVACVNGIFRVKDGGFRQWGAAEGLADTRVQWICQDEEGVVWGALLTGIVRLKDNQVRCVSRKDGLFDNNIYSIVPDDFGNLWVDSGRGIFRVSRRSMNDFADGKTAQVQCTAYDGPESVKQADKTIQERVACKTPDGRIWFPSANGVVEVDPAHLLSNLIAPPVRIDRVRANGVDLDRNQSAVVPPGQGELEFHFVALSFIAPQKLRFRYQLEGYDKDWVETGDRHMAFYTNLKPGRYTFRVVAANADGVWNVKGDVLTIELRPHYYQTGWFYSLCGGLGCAALIGVYLQRVRRLKLKEQASQKARELLEAEVQNRTAELANSRALYQALVDQLPVGVFRKNKEGRYVFVNSWFCRLKGLTEDQLLGKTPEQSARLIIAARGKDQPEERKLAEQGSGHHKLILQTGKQIETEEHYPVASGGEQYLHVLKSPVFGLDGTIVGSQGIVVDFSQHKQAEQEAEKLHRQLVDASRLAGMTEIATNVLHNVGNVLNSVNVSASLVMDRVRKSKASSLAKVVALLREHERDLGTFITSDPKGKQLPSFLAQLSGHLLADQEAALNEMDSLRRNIEHINEIVAMQQNYAKVSGVKEIVNIHALVEDSLRMNLGALSRHGVQVIRDFAQVPPLSVEKHKILQILVNLVRNAKYACDDSGRPDKRLTLRVANGNQRVKISVIDNGVGIGPDQLTRIFQHGFTTRKDGHGFGLHSGALAAREMGGSLTVQSDGPGQGATFTLELPVPPQEQTS